MKTFEESLAASSKAFIKSRLVVPDHEMAFYEMGYEDAWKASDITQLTARNAELEAEVKKLRMGLNQVVVASMMVSDTNALADIARNALKESGL